MKALHEVAPAMIEEWSVTKKHPSMRLGSMKPPSLRAELSLSLAVDLLEPSQGMYRGCFFLTTLQVRGALTTWGSCFFFISP